VLTLGVALQIESRLNTAEEKGGAEVEGGWKSDGRWYNKYRTKRDKVWGDYTEELELQLEEQRRWRVNVAHVSCDNCVNRG
jgi:hypothetical protein